MSFLKKLLLMLGLASIKPLSEIKHFSITWLTSHRGSIPYTITDDYLYFAKCPSSAPGRGVLRNVSCTLSKKNYLSEDLSPDRHCSIVLLGTDMFMLAPIPLGSDNRILLRWISYEKTPDSADVHLMIGIFDMGQCSPYKTIDMRIDVPYSAIDYRSIEAFYRLLTYEYSFDVLYRNDKICPGKICKSSYDYDGNPLLAEPLIFEAGSDDLSRDVAILPISSGDPTRGYYFWSRHNRIATIVSKDGKTKSAIKFEGFEETFDDSSNYGGFSNALDYFGACYATKDRAVRCIQVDESLQVLGNYYGKDIFERGAKLLRMRNLGKGEIFLASVTCREGTTLCDLELTKIRTSGERISARTEFVHFRECGGEQGLENFDVKMFKKGEDVMKLVFLCFGRKLEQQTMKVTMKEITLVKI